jgi:hypothetical protein
MRKYKTATKAHDAEAIVIAALAAKDREDLTPREEAVLDEIYGLAHKFEDMATGDDPEPLSDIRTKLSEPQYSAALKAKLDRIAKSNKHMVRILTDAELAELDLITDEARKGWFMYGQRQLAIGPGKGGRMRVWAL